MILPFEITLGQTTFVVNRNLLSSHILTKQVPSMGSKIYGGQKGRTICGRQFEWSIAGVQSQASCAAS